MNGGALVRTDPTRIAAQIVSGIGFLGAGAIIRQGLSVKRPDDGGHAVARRRDRHGVGRGLLQRGALRDRRRAAHARPAAHRRVQDRPPLPARGRPPARRDPGGRQPGRRCSRRSSGAAAASSRSRSRRRATAAAIAVDVELRGIEAPLVVADVGEIDGVLEVRWTESSDALLAQRAQGARARAAAARLDDRAARRGRLARGDRRDVLRERAAQGGVRLRRASAAGRSARTRASRSRRSAAGPALHSARYAPEGLPAIAKLLGELEGVEDRRARYVSELVAIAPDRDDAARHRHRSRA